MRTMRWLIGAVGTAVVWAWFAFLAVSALVLAVGSFVSIVYLVGHFAFGWS